VRVKLTDRAIKAFKPAAAGKRDVYLDTLVPGLALRVTDNKKGHKSFVLIARYPQQPKNPSPRSLGTYGAITLDQARDKARAWLAMIDKGIDPESRRHGRRRRPGRYRPTPSPRSPSNSLRGIARSWQSEPRPNESSGAISSSAGARGLSPISSRRKYQRPFVPSHGEDFTRRTMVSDIFDGSVRGRSARVNLASLPRLWSGCGRSS